MGNLIALIQCSMQKIYLLLRNNQQSGPFTREELLQQVLRKDDLVWVEGKSAGWRNPEEIAELKTEPETAPGPPVADTGKAEKPADAVPARKSNHVYISLPSGMTRITEPATTAAQAPVVPDEEEKQDSFEERVLHMQQRVAAYNKPSAAPEKPIAAPENKEELATKYTRSLDDIREEYASWLDRQKKRKPDFRLKPMMTAAAALVVIALVSFFVLRKKEGEPQIMAGIQPGVQVAASPASLAAASEEQMLAPTKNTGTKKQVAKKEPRAAKKATAVKYAAGRSAPTGKSGTANLPVAKKEPVNEQPSLPLSRLIRIFGNDAKKDKKGIDDFQLTVQNNSRQDLKVVAVDIFYYGTNGRQLQKKTLYFSNLSPHRSLSLTAPGHKKATAVEYKLGLVSSDQGLYYAKQ